MSQRKLIRPKISDVKKKGKKNKGSRKPTPPEQTYAEVYYYLKQMHRKTPMVVVMLDGEVLKGWIEWYDRGVIKLNRHDEPNLMIPKHAIKYIYKDIEALEEEETEAPEEVEEEEE